MPIPAAVIFDIGNVLLNWDPNQLYKSLIPDDAERAAFFEDTNLNAMNEQVDLGAPFRDTIYAHAEKFPEHRDLIRQWHDRWLEMAYSDIPETARILRDLKSQGVPVYALSNFGVDSLELARKHYSVLTEFDREYISGHMQVIKPDPEIYARVEQDCGLSGDQLFFTDDRADNIAAAAARDWQTHLFTTPRALASALKDAGIALS